MENLVIEITVDLNKDSVTIIHNFHDAKNAVRILKSAILKMESDIILLEQENLG